jgi:hypothetical protein
MQDHFSNYSKLKRKNLGYKYNMTHNMTHFVSLKLCIILVFKFNLFFKEKSTPVSVFDKNKKTNEPVIFS